MAETDLLVLEFDKMDGEGSLALELIIRFARAEYLERKTEITCFRKNKVLRTVVEGSRNESSPKLFDRHLNH